MIKGNPLIYREDRKTNLPTICVNQKCKAKFSTSFNLYQDYNGFVNCTICGHNYGLYIKKIIPFRLEENMTFYLRA